MHTNRKPQGADRRRDARQGAGWLGTYLMPGQPALGWAECRVLDISSSGVGLELYGPPWPPDDEDSDLVVKLDASNSPALGAARRAARAGATDLGIVELPGVIRNRAASRFGFVRVGVEFVGLTSEERRLVDAIVDHQLV